MLVTMWCCVHAHRNVGYDASASGKCFCTCQATLLGGGSAASCRPYENQSVCEKYFVILGRTCSARGGCSTEAAKSNVCGNCAWSTSGGGACFKSTKECEMSGEVLAADRARAAFQANGLAAATCPFPHNGRVPRGVGLAGVVPNVLVHGPAPALSRFCSVCAQTRWTQGTLLQLSSPWHAWGWALPTLAGPQGDPLKRPRHEPHGRTSNTRLPATHRPRLE